MNIPWLFWISFAILNLVLLFLIWRNCKLSKDKLNKAIKKNKQRKRKYDIKKLKDQIEPNVWLILFISIIVCVDIWVVGAIGSHWWAGKYFTDVVSDCPSQPTGLDSIRAAFGDSFGAVNALISALAFAGVLITFFLQRYELRLQRRELEAQREEFEQQNETLALQRFENTFFHMLELHKQNVREIKVGELEGRYAFNNDD